MITKPTQISDSISTVYYQCTLYIYSFGIVYIVLMYMCIVGNGLGYSTTAVNNNSTHSQLNNYETVSRDTLSTSVEDIML